MEQAPEMWVSMGLCGFVSGYCLHTLFDHLFAVSPVAYYKPCPMSIHVLECWMLSAKDVLCLSWQMRLAHCANLQGQLKDLAKDWTTKKQRGTYDSNLQKLKQACMELLTYLFDHKDLNRSSIMQFCSLDRIWAREVAHLLSLSALQIIFWNYLLTLYDSIGFQTPGTLKILWIAAGESWHSWQPSFSGRTLRWVGEIPSKDQG